MVNITLVFQLQLRLVHVQVIFNQRDYFIKYCVQTCYNKTGHGLISTTEAPVRTHFC
jgi:hypothetical protein